MPITVQRARPDDLAAVVALLASHGLPEAGVADHLATAFVARSNRFTRITRDDVPADVRQSVEFTTACPASALVMRRALGSE